MKSLPLRTTLLEQIDGVRLYRDDLERILGLFKAAGLAVTISDDAFQFDSLVLLSQVETVVHDCQVPYTCEAAESIDA